MLIDALSYELLLICSSGYQNLFTKDRGILILEEFHGIGYLLGPILWLLIILTVEEDIESLQLADFSQELAEKMQTNLSEAKSEQALLALWEIQNCLHQTR